MIDIHAHILPGIDDGAADLDSALEMAAMAVESGVTVVAATPHSTCQGQGRNLWGPELARSIKGFRQALREANIPLQIAPGMEIFGTPQVPQMLGQGKMVGLNASEYPLIEFPFTDYADQATGILEQVRAMGLRPVVAHPERYRYVQKDPRLLNRWAGMGCLLQVNKGSLLGRFGRQERQLSMELVGRGFVFAVASDAHSPAVRTTWMADVEELLQEEFSVETAEKLLQDNPLRLLKNEKIHGAEPHWF